jgi:outer membrane murein-binding lipoprotein Lpp
MKKMLVVLAIAGMFLVSCSKEELNKLQAENATLGAEKATLETQVSSLTQEKDAALAQLTAVMAEKDRAVFVLDSIKTKYKIKM